MLPVWLMKRLFMGTEGSDLNRKVLSADSSWPCTLAGSGVGRGGWAQPGSEALSAETQGGARVLRRRVCGLR